MESEVQSPQLPYQVIDKPVGRPVIQATLKQNGGKIGRTTYFIPFKKITEREGFNVRTDMGDIEALASDILQNGLNVPLTVDLFKKGAKTTWYVEMGHRRFAAIQSLEKAGHNLKKLELPGFKEGMVECFVNQVTVDEYTRIVRLFSSNHHKELNPLEIAKVIERLKTYYNKSNLEISHALGLSRQTVDNYMILNGLSDQEKEGIRKGNISVTAAVQLARKVKDEQKRADMISEKGSSKKMSVREAKSINMPDENVGGLDVPGPDEEEVDESQLDNAVKNDISPFKIRKDWQNDTSKLTQEEIDARYHEDGIPLDDLPGPRLTGAQTKSLAAVDEFINNSNPEAENKDEYQLCMRMMANLDKLFTKADQLKTQHGNDMGRLITFVQKDLEVVRKYVKNCRK